VRTVLLRGGVAVEQPLEVALGFLEAYATYETDDSTDPVSFDESDLRRANRGGARISSVEIAAILERRREIESALRAIPTDASLAKSSIPWGHLTGLFDAFADIRGVGFSKMTKALHKKRPALIPMLDSVVQEYLLEGGRTPRTGSFGERGTDLVRTYKDDLDRNLPALREIKSELAWAGYRVTEVRLLDLFIWSTSAAS
jgi:hypothetical protein